MVPALVGSIPFLATTSEVSEDPFVLSPSPVLLSSSSSSSEVQPDSPIVAPSEPSVISDMSYVPEVSPGRQFYQQMLDSVDDISDAVSDHFLSFIVSYQVSKRRLSVLVVNALLNQGVLPSKEISALVSDFMQGRRDPYDYLDLLFSTQWPNDEYELDVVLYVFQHRPPLEAIAVLSDYTGDDDNIDGWDADCTLIYPGRLSLSQIPPNRQIVGFSRGFVSIGQLSLELFQINDQDYQSLPPNLQRLWDSQLIGGAHNLII